jgi:hypothetical protein
VPYSTQSLVPCGPSQSPDRSRTKSQCTIVLCYLYPKKASLQHPQHYAEIAVLTFWKFRHQWLGHDTHLWGLVPNGLRSAPIQVVAVAALQLRAVSLNMQPGLQELVYTSGSGLPSLVVCCNLCLLLHSCRIAGRHCHTVYDNVS